MGIINVGDVLQFKVSAGTESGDIDYHISASDLNRGALQFNITFGERKGEIKGEISDAEEEPTLVPPLPQGPITTPTPVVTPTPTSTPTMAPSEEKKGEGKGIPGFEAAYAIALIALIAISYLILRRKKG